MNPEHAMEVTAYHEAGHALRAVQLGGKVISVTIEPDDDEGPQRSGDTQVRWRRKRLSERQFRERCVQVALAGPVAEMIYTGDPFHPALVAEWAGDWRDADAAAATFLPDPAARVAYLEQTTLQLYRLFNGANCWAALAALADHLLAHDTLDDEEIRDILEAWPM